MHTSLFSINQLNFTSKPHSCRVVKRCDIRSGSDLPSLTPPRVLLRFWVLPRIQGVLFMGAQRLSPNPHHQGPVALSDLLLWAFCEDQESSKVRKNLMPQSPGADLDHPQRPATPSCLDQQHTHRLGTARSESASLSDPQ